MSESRRRSSAHHASQEQLHQPKKIHGFVNKLFADIRKLCVYQPDQIKWMNEKPKQRKAYEPTEVRLLIFLKIAFLHHKSSWVRGAKIRRTGRCFESYHVAALTLTFTYWSLHFRLNTSPTFLHTASGYFQLHTRCFSWYSDRRVRISLRLLWCMARHWFCCFVSALLFTACFTATKTWCSKTYYIEWTGPWSTFSSLAAISHG